MRLLKKCFGHNQEEMSFKTMSKTIHAVFENGIFRPVDPVDLPDRVEVEFEPRILDKNDRWPDCYFETTAGAFAKEPLDRPDQDKKKLGQALRAEKTSILLR
jgi:hypothetical protein